MVPLFEDADVDGGNANHGNNEDNDLDEISKVYHQHPGPMRKATGCPSQPGPFKGSCPYNPPPAWAPQKQSPAGTQTPPPSSAIFCLPVTVCPYLRPPFEITRPAHRLPALALWGAFLDIVVM